MNSVAFSPDGRQIISGSNDNTVKLWDAATGREIRTFSGHSDIVLSVAFSPDGKQILSGSGNGTVKLWDLATGQEIKTFPGYSGAVHSVAFSPDGSQIVSGSGSRYRGTVKLWDIATGHDIWTLQHSDFVSSVAFSPDGSQIASGSGGGLFSSDGIIKLLDAATGREIMTISGHSDSVSSVAFSPDGSQIVSCSKGIVSSRDHTIKLRDTTTGQEIRTFYGHSDGVNSVAFSPDGSQIVSGSEDNTIILWDLASGKKLRTFSGYSYGVDSVAFSPDGSQLVSGSLNGIDLWYLALDREMRNFSGYSEWISSVAFNPNGSQVISGSLDGIIRLWDVAVGRDIRIFLKPGNVTSVAYSPNGRQIISGSWGKTVILWDAYSGHEISTFSGHSGEVMSVAFSHDGRQVISGSAWGDGTIKLWDVTTNREIITFSGHSEGVSSVTFSPDGSQIVSCSTGIVSSGDHTIKLWDIATGREAMTFSEFSPWGASSVAFSPDGNQIISGSGYADYGVITLWDLTTGHGVKSFYGHSGYVSSVAFSPDGSQIISGSSYDRLIKLWDVATGQEIWTFSGHTDAVYSVAFSPDGNTIISGSRDGTTRLWDTSTGKEIAQFIGFPDGEWIVITPDGYYNASPGGDKYINVRVGNDVYGLDQFGATFYNPLIVEARLQGRPDPIMATENIRNAIFIKPPEVVISNPDGRIDISSDRVELSATVIDQNQPIRNIELVVNGRRVGQDGMRGVSGGGDRAGFSMASPTLNVTGTGNRASFRFPVNLSPGRNIIEVIAFNGFTHGRQTIEVNCLSAEVRLPNLWILSIGINDYNNSKNLENLKYAVNDAKGIIDVFKTQEGKLYGKVNSLLIADGEEIAPTRNHIIDSFDKYFRQAGENDIVLLFIAGHGMSDNDRNFYFMPNDAAFYDDGSIRASSVISHRDIQSALDRNGQKLVFIDACHSEGTASGLTRRTDYNHLTNELKNNSTVVFTSSGMDEKSVELDEYEHGAFTWAILEGLRGKAYPNREGNVTMMGLNYYVMNEVPRLVQLIDRDREQNPTLCAPNGLRDFPLAYPEANRSNTSE